MNDKQKIIIHKKHAIYKKIALRFLKDTKLLHTFKQYLKYISKKNKTRFISENVNNWYKVTYIDEIFGRTMFTDYIYEKKNKCLYETTISDIFRFYIETLYPQHKNFSRLTVGKSEENVEINKQNKTIKILWKTDHDKIME